jgi:hypothetical protein
MDISVLITTSAHTLPDPGLGARQDTSGRGRLCRTLRHLRGTGANFGSINLAGTGSRVTGVRSQAQLPTARWRVPLACYLCKKKHSMSGMARGHGISGAGDTEEGHHRRELIRHAALLTCHWPGFRWCSAPRCTAPLAGGDDAVMPAVRCAHSRPESGRSDDAATACATLSHELLDDSGQR